MVSTNLKPIKYSVTRYIPPPITIANISANLLLWYLDITSLQIIALIEHNILPYVIGNDIFSRLILTLDTFSNTTKDIINITK